MNIFKEIAPMPWVRVSALSLKMTKSGLRGKKKKKKKGIFGQFFPPFLSGINFIFLLLQRKKQKSIHFLKIGLAVLTQKRKTPGNTILILLF